ncbi:uncharacterized protein N7479_003895 [Penicillium vulpinum]|nr:uncharacterized protein N7479_003895 [Penicillium vulpinum]KAJ5964019.1 hypothetical protein N7479_003895 [Penicillium vulpinum]
MSDGVLKESREIALLVGKMVDCTNLVYMQKGKFKDILPQALALPRQQCFDGRPQGHKATRPQGHKATRLQGYKATNSQ